MGFTDVFGKRIMIFDGSTGTFLQRKGLRGGEIPEIWNFTHPDEVKSIPAAYLASGADVVSTNTFGANRYKLSDAGLSVSETVDAADADSVSRSVSPMTVTPVTGEVPALTTLTTYVTRSPGR